ncbi:MAG: cytochrome ubiquinol oxidase subunit I [Thermodesulfobacteriota bacterium]
MRFTAIIRPRHLLRLVSLTAIIFAAFFFFTMTPKLSHGAALRGEAAAAGSEVEFVKPAAAHGNVGSRYAPAPRLHARDYHRIKGVNGRVAVWLAAQMHLWFAAFVLSVPIFVLILEGIGMMKSDRRYDRVAYEFIRVTITAYSLTALTGGLLLLSLLVFYPQLIGYLSGIFGPTMLAYAFLFFFESLALYIYYYGWHSMSSGTLKWLHLTTGLLLNASGITLMFIANAWMTFMISPGGVDSAGVFDGNIWHAIHTALWNPLNLHRFISNIAYGGSIVGAYAAYKFLSAQGTAERAYYDWMGYTASIIAVAALLPLPFAGYWLAVEIYAYSQQMGVTLMGGVFGRIFIMQAVVIGSLFLAANYYLWCGMHRSDGAGRYTGYVKYIAFILFLCFLVWFTPHTLVLKASEELAMGGRYHALVAPLGLMPAKNTAINIMLLCTSLSFLLYRRANRVSVVSWASYGNAAITALYVAGTLNIIFLGVYYGYFTDTVYKVISSIPQVSTTLAVISAAFIIEYFMLRGAREFAPIRWGRMPRRSQYALVLIAVSLTWLMGLMGYISEAIRQQWHITGIMKDNSPDAYTPALSYAVKTVSIGTVIFLGIILFIFWLGQLKTSEGSSA